MGFEAMWSRVGKLGMGLRRKRQYYAPQKIIEMHDTDIMCIYKM